MTQKEVLRQSTGVSGECTGGDVVQEPAQAQQTARCRGEGTEISYMGDGTDCDVCKVQSM